MVSSAYISSQIIVKKMLLAAILFVVLIHSVGILLPETGFDALWYHLPIVKDMAESGTIRYLPQIQQSNQPRLGEIIFLPWFFFLGVTGVKLCTFALMLVLLFITYKLATHYLEAIPSLGAVLLVASFHTVAWQATSAYTDILRTIFELGILILLTQKKRVQHETLLLGILVVAALLTKLVALPFLPALLLFVYGKRGGKTVLVLAAIATSVYVLGQFPLTFFFSVSHDLLGITQLLASLRSFLLLPLELSFHAESYTTPLFLFALPFLWRQRRWLKRKFSAEILFLLASLATWVLVVPVSVRYDLSAIILATIICFVAVVRLATRHAFVQSIFIVFLSFNLLLNLSIRLGVVVRSLPILLGQETEQEYLKRFDQGILRGPLEKWYGPASSPQDRVQ